jgi:hypothetical protein
MQPANQTVTAGQTATFTAAASGSPTPTVQWQLSTNGGSTWGNIAGATATTFAVTNTTTSQSGSEYRAVFTNSAGSATSNAATLTVSVSSGSTTVTFRQGVAGYTGGQDAGIDTQYAIYNGGNGVQYLNQPYLEIGTDGQGSIFESLLRFSNLGIPTNGVVSAASLTVTLVDWWGNTSVTGYYVNNAWSTTDGTIGWVHRGGGLNWATPGALGQGTDLVAGKSFTLPTTNANGPQTMTITLDPSVVQSWIANPAADQGVLLVTSAPRTVSVNTAENSTVSVRPLLKVTYSTPAAMAPMSRSSSAASTTSPTSASQMNAALALANKYVADVAAPGAYNHYGLPASITYVNGVIHATTECAPLVRLVLENAYASVTPTALQGLTGSTQPDSAQFHDAIAAQTTFVQGNNTFAFHARSAVSAIQPGDILAAKYASAHGSGHTMLVNTITLVGSNLTGIFAGMTVNEYRVQVIDSTSSPHTGDPNYPDSRGTTGQGIGTGYILLYEDAQSGALVGWTWNTKQRTPYQSFNPAGSNYRPIDAGYLTGPGIS